MKASVQILNADSLLQNFIKRAGQTILHETNNKLGLFYHLTCILGSLMLTKLDSSMLQKGGKINLEETRIGVAIIYSIW